MHGLSAIPPELVRFLKNVPNGLIHPEMKRKFFPLYRPPPPSPPCSGDRLCILAWLMFASFPKWDRKGPYSGLFGSPTMGSSGSNEGGVVTTVQRYKKFTLNF